MEQADGEIYLKPELTATNRLEFTDGELAQRCRHRISGLQPLLVEEHQRVGIDPRLLTEPDRRVASLLYVQGGDPHRAHNARTLSRHVARRTDYRHRGWR